jgi:hypothetical protein
VWLEHAGLEAASHNYASSASGVLAMWLSLNFRSVSGRKRDLEDIYEGCRNVFDELGRILDKYGELGPTPGELARELKEYGRDSSGSQTTFMSFEIRSLQTSLCLIRSLDEYLGLYLSLPF